MAYLENSHYNYKKMHFGQLCQTAYQNPGSYNNSTNQLGVAIGTLVASVGIFAFAKCFKTDRNTPAPGTTPATTTPTVASAPAASVSYKASYSSISDCNNTISSALKDINDITDSNYNENSNLDKKTILDNYDTTFKANPKYTKLSTEVTNLINALGGESFTNLTNATNDVTTKTTKYNEAKQAYENAINQNKSYKKDGVTNQSGKYTDTQLKDLKDKMKTAEDELKEAKKKEKDLLEKKEEYNEKKAELDALDTELKNNKKILGQAIDDFNKAKTYKEERVLFQNDKSSFTDKLFNDDNSVNDEVYGRYKDENLVQQHALMNLSQRFDNCDSMKTDPTAEKYKLAERFVNLYNQHYPNGNESLKTTLEKMENFMKENERFKQQQEEQTT